MKKWLTWVVASICLLVITAILASHDYRFFGRATYFDVNNGRLMDVTYALYVPVKRVYSTPLKYQSSARAPDWRITVSRTILDPISPHYTYMMVPGSIFRMQTGLEDLHATPARVQGELERAMGYARAGNIEAIYVMMRDIATQEVKTKSQEEDEAAVAQ